MHLQLPRQEPADLWPAASWREVMQISSTVADSVRQENTRAETEACILFDVLSWCIHISQQIYSLSMLLIPHLPLIDHQEQTGVASKYCTEINTHVWL